MLRGILARGKSQQVERHKTPKMKLLPTAFGARPLGEFSIDY